MCNWKVPLKEGLLGGDAGTVLTVEAVLVGSLAALGAVCSLSAARAAIIAEFSDAAGSVQDLNQSYLFNSPMGHSSTVLASGFADQLDFCDDAEDVSGQIDNCVTFESPVDEGVDVIDEKVPSVSGVGVTLFDSVSADGSSGTGSLGDGTTSTGVNLTTNSGGIASVRSGGGVGIDESRNAAGNYRFEFDDPLVNVEFFIASLWQHSLNRIGNFTITLSDGTVINNAAFTIVPDTIINNGAVGPFTANGGSTRLLAQISLGGAEYATSNSSGQAAGRLRFADIPTAVGPDCVGVTAIEFQKLGGRARVTGAGIVVSGQIVTEN